MWGGIGGGRGATGLLDVLVRVVSRFTGLETAADVPDGSFGSSSWLDLRTLRDLWKAEHMNEAWGICGGMKTNKKHL